jgi:hypothetical protein
MLEKQEVIERLCAIRGRVASQVFGWRVCCDCVCCKQSAFPEFKDDGQVLRFIEEAVESAMQEHLLSPHRTGEAG